MPPPHDDKRRRPLLRRCGIPLILGAAALASVAVSTGLAIGADLTLLRRGMAQRSVITAPRRELSRRSSAAVAPPPPLPPPPSNRTTSGAHLTRVCRPMPIERREDFAKRHVSATTPLLIPRLLTDGMLAPASALRLVDEFGHVNQDAGIVIAALLDESISSSSCRASPVRPKAAAARHNGGGRGGWAGLVTPFAPSGDPCAAPPPRLDDYLIRQLVGNPATNLRASDCRPAAGAPPRCAVEGGFDRVDGLEPPCSLACKSFRAGCGQPTMLFDWPIPDECSKSWLGGGGLRLPPSFADAPVTLFVAGAGTGGKLHIDGNGTAFWGGLVAGAKEWVVLGGESTAGLRTRRSSTGEPDAFDPGFTVPAGDCWIAEQNAGDVVFVPHGLAHQVRNRRASVALSSNFAPRRAS